MHRRLSFATRARLVTLLALALAVRALVPTGWMPVLDEGGVHLILCPGQGPVAHVMTGMAHGEKHDGKGAPDHPCAFAGVGLPADTAPPPLTQAQVATPAMIADRRSFPVAVGRGLAAPPPPATGPPAFA